MHELNKRLKGKEAPWVIFDLDGTLANGDHRQHILREYIDRGDNESGPSGADWDRFHAGCGADNDYSFVVHLNWGLAQTLNVAILTGRTERWRTATELWLENHDVYWSELHMRANDDRRRGTEYKSGVLDTAFEGRLIVGAFEDRVGEVKMYRARGIPCLQTKEESY